MAMTSGIYSITNSVNGKVYIGQSINIHSRLQQHKKCHSSEMVVTKALLKYGISSFIFEVVELCDPTLLNEKERYWISLKNSIVPIGYNCTSGGDSKGTISEQTRKAMSKAQKGKTVTTNTKEKLRAINTGKQHKESSKEKASVASKNRWSCPLLRSMMLEANKKYVENRGPVSSETKAKISAALTGKTRSAEQCKKLAAAHGCHGIVRSDGVEFDSVSDAARSVNGHTTNISKVLKGQRKMAYGYSYKLKELT